MAKDWNRGCVIGINTYTDACVYGSILHERDLHTTNQAASTDPFRAPPAPLVPLGATGHYGAAAKARERRERWDCTCTCVEMGLYLYLCVCPYVYVYCKSQTTRAQHAHLTRPPSPPPLLRPHPPTTTTTTPRTGPPPSPTPFSTTSPPSASRDRKVRLWVLAVGLRSSWSFLMPTAGMCVYVHGRLTG